MADIEKVIKGLEICIDRVPGKYNCNKCPYEIDGNYCEINLSKDALALLKEQDAEIDETSDEYLDLGNEIAKMPKVVRCKDCKHWHNDGIITTCDKHVGNGYPADWYCADGERREGR